MDEESSDEDLYFFIAMDVAGAGTSRAAGPPAGAGSVPSRRASAGARRWGGSPLDNSCGPSSRNQASGGGCCWGCFDLVDPILGRNLRISASELGEVDIGPHHILTRGMSGDRSLGRISESDLCF